MSYHIGRSLLSGSLKKCVFFHCPACGHELVSPFVDAGQEDACPTCRQIFVIPGEDELVAEKLSKKSQVVELENQQKEAAQERERVEREAQAAREKKAQEEEAKRCLSQERKEARREEELEERQQYISFEASQLRLQPIPRYQALSTIAVVLRVVGGINAALLVLFCAQAMTSGVGLGLLVLFAIGLSAGVVILMLFAVASACDALRDIARNSFVMARG